MRFKMKEEKLNLNQEEFTTDELYKFAKAFCKAYENSMNRVAEYLDKELTSDDTDVKKMLQNFIAYVDQTQEDILDTKSSLQAVIVADFVKTLPKDLQEAVMLSCVMDVMDMVKEDKEVKI